MARLVVYLHTTSTQVLATWPVGAHNCYGGIMSKGNSSVSKGDTYSEIGVYWDNHDLADHWEQTQPVDFQVDIRSEVIYYPLEATLSMQMRSLAERRGYLLKHC